MREISFLCYSDIHYHHYTNGLLLSDIERVEDEMLEHAQALKVDFILFLGDRYLSRNPMYEAALASDRMLKKISDSGIPWYGLIGNHDRITKNDFKMHTMSHIGMYPSDLFRVTIMDQRAAYSNVFNNVGVTFHAVPAGHEPKDFKIDYQADFNICLMHGLIMGTAFHNGTLVENGLLVSSFDKEFDLVLGGDNHTRQEIKGLNHCRGFYVGAPCSHNWGDEGAVRGFMHVTMTTSDADHDTRGRVAKVIKHTWIDSRSPKFMKVNWLADSTEQLIFAAEHGTAEWKNNIIKLNIAGPSDILNDLNIDLWKSKLIIASKARTVDIKLKYDTTVSTVIQSSGPISDADEWISFLTTKSSDLDKIDVAYLEKLGVKYINNV